MYRADRYVLVLLSSTGPSEIDIQGESGHGRFLGSLHDQYRRQQPQFTSRHCSCEHDDILAWDNYNSRTNAIIDGACLQFHQVVRASTPLFTILISVLFFRGKFSVMKLVSLLPVIAGVGFA
jgi:hypothetical protein